MELLKNVRSLLIDVQRVLEEALPGYETHALKPQLDKAILDLTVEVLPKPDGSTRTTAQQVAQAWQSAARGIKLTHPALYEELSEKVMRMLDVRDLPDPANELLQLEAQLKKAEGRLKPIQDRLQERDRELAALRSQIGALYQALAEAAPNVFGAKDPQTLALQRIAELQSGKAVPAAPGKKGGKPAAPVDDRIPSRAVLEAVAAGQRQFTQDQREWSVGECLGLTGFQYTPVEMINHGDAWMAKTILESPNAPA